MNKVGVGSIGVFDSGVGGLSVLREIKKVLPTENFIYLADQIHVPYGERSLEEVRKYSKAIIRFLLDQGAGLIVVACNTASAAALHYLRKKYPEVPIVGMEPAVKPAAEYSLTKKVGVLATPATFQGKLYTSVVERFAQDVEIFQHTCPGLVYQIELGEVESLPTRNILESALKPMLAKGIDTIVLGCTHYPLVLSLIQEIVGKDVRVIDPAPAIARRVVNLMTSSEYEQSRTDSNPVLCFSTGDPTKFERSVSLFLQEEGMVNPVFWNLEKQYLTSKN
ncbi:glutamate racemase [Chloroflexota bacterium]